MDPAVVFEDVTFAYNQMPILAGVNLTIDDGVTVGIIGPNGGGKTTLLKLIMGFLQPQCGTVQVLGGRPKDMRRKLAYVPQGLHFDRSFPVSVEEVVLSGRLSRTTWWGRYHTADWAAARKALRKVGLVGLKDQQFGALSGGQRQRTLIARALVSDPKILILDEPTANIDSKAEADVYKILGELKGTMTILMVTHDLGIAVQQVDRVLCVQKETYWLQPDEICQHFAIGLYHRPVTNDIPIQPQNAVFGKEKPPAIGRS